MIWDALGPYVAYIGLAMLYGWPFILPGAWRWAVGVPWLVLSVGLTVLTLAGRARAAKLGKS